MSSSFFPSHHRHQYYQAHSSSISAENTSSVNTDHSRYYSHQQQYYNQRTKLYPPPVIMEGAIDYQCQEDFLQEKLSMKAHLSSTLTADNTTTHRLEFLISKIEDKSLMDMLQHELQLLNFEQHRLVTALEQRMGIISSENEELKIMINESQKRYEKAVREMQFFKKKYDKFITIQQQQQQLPPPPPTPPATTSSATSASASPMTNEMLINWPTSPTSLITSSTTTDTTTVSSRRRKNSNTTGSVFSAFSSTTADSASEIIPNMINCSISSASTTTSKKMTVAMSGFSRNNSMMSSSSIPSSSAGYSNNGSNNSCASSIYSSSAYQYHYQQPLPMMTAPSIRSTHTGHTVATTATSSNITSSSMIQQRRTDPLVFGGSDALWDTISKGQGGDATVEKIISNFLRRGGSPNTAKQSPTSSTYPAVKYGYGMIHALIVTKAPISLELLLQQGANPDVVSLGQSEEDKVSPCYLAASVGWLTGLQKLIAFGGDLISARGAGSLKKTALHVAAEHGHAAVTEYIINMTQGVLNLETDSLGATVLHYACVSGHTDLVSFIINVCEVPLDRADCKGDWPIHYAARHGRFEVVILLVEKYRCDINAYTPSALKNSSSKKLHSTSTGTPYDIAKSCGHKRLVEYIKSNGGVTAKKMEKRREEEMSQKIPAHLQSALAKNGLMSSF